jgi:hypothetical protein
VPPASTEDLRKFVELLSGARGRVRSSDWFGARGQHHHEEVLMSGPYNGPGGGEFTIEDGDIILVDGPADWIIWGIGQDVTVRMKNGPGSLTLRGFKNITITEKNGAGKLIIEGDNESVTIKKMDGPGSAYIRIKGKKKIQDKNGEGNIFFKDSPPIVEKIDGPGKPIREG